MEPRRRQRLPLAAMSEGAHRRISIASLRLRLNDERRPGFRVAAGPARADEGGAEPPRRRGGFNATTATNPLPQGRKLSGRPDVDLDASKGGSHEDCPGA